MSTPFPAELNRVARGWPIKAQCRQKLELAQAHLMIALTALHEAPTQENMAWVNSMWARAQRVLWSCGEYKPGPSGTPGDGDRRDRWANIVKELEGKAA